VLVFLSHAAVALRCQLPSKSPITAVLVGANLEVQNPILGLNVGTVVVDDSSEKV
jgi:hypothetical protein